MGGSGGSDDPAMGGSPVVSSGGTCSELTELSFVDAGFESGGTVTGWAGSGNYPQYASITVAAAPGVPGVLIRFWAYSGTPSPSQSVAQ